MNLLQAWIRYKKSLCRSCIGAWDRYWFSSMSTWELSFARMALGLVAILYVLSWVPTLGSWIDDSGALPSSLLAISSAMGSRNW